MTFDRVHFRGSAVLSEPLAGRRRRVARANLCMSASAERSSIPDLEARRWLGAGIERCDAIWAGRPGTGRPVLTEQEDSRKSRVVSTYTGFAHPQSWPQSYYL